MSLLSNESDASSAFPRADTRHRPLRVVTRRWATVAAAIGWSAQDQSFGLDKYVPKKQTVTQF